MNQHLITLLCAVPLAACNLMWAGNPGRTNDIGVGIKQPPADTAPSAPTQVAYQCDRGLKLTVTFDTSAGKAIIVRPGRAPLTLDQVVADSGFRYSDGASALSGQGDEAMWTTDGNSVRCVAKS